MIGAQLLHELYSTGSELVLSSNPLLKQWGLHLLEDWKSLELLAQREGEEPAPPRETSAVKQ